MITAFPFPGADGFGGDSTLCSDDFFLCPWSRQSEMPRTLAKNIFFLRNYFFLMQSYLFGCTGSLLAARGIPVASCGNLLSLTRDRTWVTCIAGQILNHWITREIPQIFFMSLLILGKVKSLSCVQLFPTSWTVACQAPLLMGFSRQDYWSGLPFPSPGYIRGR